VYGRNVSIFNAYGKMESGENIVEERNNVGQSVITGALQTPFLPPIRSWHRASITFGQQKSEGRNIQKLRPHKGLFADGCCNMLDGWCQHPWLPLRRARGVAVELLEVLHCDRFNVGGTC
jgi:hypothetical protein